MVVNTSPRFAGLLIERVEWTSDEKPPWSGIQFKFPVGSDELSDALRSRYPNGSNLRERKHMAVLEFLSVELRSMQSQGASQIAAADHCLTSSDGPSPYTKAVIGRNQQNKAHVTGQTESTNESATLSSITKPGQQIVFSVMDGCPKQPRTKRHMTQKEKAEYKRTRQRGACPTCRRQKARCTHVEGAYEPSADFEQTGKNLKRQLSFDASIDDAQARNVRQPNTPGVFPRADHSLSPDSRPVRPESEYPTPGFTELSDHSVTIENNIQWLGPAGPDSQAETPRSHHDIDSPNVTSAIDYRISVNAISASAPSPHTMI